MESSLSKFISVKVCNWICTNYTTNKHVSGQTQCHSQVSVLSTWFLASQTLFLRGWGCRTVSQSTALVQPEISHKLLDELQ